MNSIKDIRKEFERRQGEKTGLEKAIALTASELKRAKITLIRHEKARQVAREVGLKTQQQLQYHISDIATMALDAIFAEPYRLSVEFLERRNKLECDLLFEKGGEKVNPLTASGGGAVDVASFALRIASWTMENPRSRPTMILDEPLKYVSADLQDKASMMLKEISDRLGIQFIIVTHEETLTEYADRIFTVNIKKGISKITQS